MGLIPAVNLFVLLTLFVVLVRFALSLKKNMQHLERQVEKIAQQQSELRERMVAFEK